MNVLGWTLNFDRIAERQLRKLDKQVAARILRELEEVVTLDNPRSRGKALTGSLRSLWRYRVGDYRVICAIEDAQLLILVITVDHRSSVYKNHLPF